MKNLLLFSLLLLSSLMYTGCSKKPYPAVSYPFGIIQDNLDSAKAAAVTQDKNIFLMVHADWCSVCNTFKTSVLQSADIKTTLTNTIVTSLIDGDKPYGKPIADKYGVNSFPTFLILDKTGVVLATKKGNITESVFKEWVKPYLK
jgi:thioredoxin 1